MDGQSLCVCLLESSGKLDGTVNVLQKTVEMRVWSSH